MLAFLQQQLHQPLFRNFKATATGLCHLLECASRPAEQIVLEAVDFAKQQNIDVVLGFGGGSAMDVAKIIAVLSHPEQTQQLSDLYGVGNAKAPRLPLILVLHYGRHRFRSHTYFHCHHRCNQ